VFRACFALLQGGRRAGPERCTGPKEAAPEWIYGGRSECMTAPETARCQM